MRRKNGQCEKKMKVAEKWRSGDKDKERERERRGEELGPAWQSQTVPTGSSSKRCMMSRDSEKIL